jgi:hypothetical protein
LEIAEAAAACTAEEVISGAVMPSKPAINRGSLRNCMRLRGTTGVKATPWFMG